MEVSVSAPMSARAAAARVGVSERTLRRWIAAGLLAADKVGGAFVVDLEAVRTLAATRRSTAADNAARADMSAASHTEPSEVADTSAADSQADVSALVVLVTRLHDEVSAAKDEARQHAATAAMWQERAGTLADRLAAAESKLLALSAPESLPEASTSPQPVGEAPEPFWRRWRTSAPWLLIVIILLLAVAVGQPAWVR